jgi:hypothetical protein
MSGSPQAMETDENDSAPQIEAAAEQKDTLPEDPVPPSKGTTSIPPQEATSQSTKIQELMNKALQFLSTASNETLVACVMGLCACTYFILGRLGLVLLGVVGGILLHASWDGSNGDSSDLELKANEAKKKRQLGIVVAQKVLSWRDSRNTAGAVDGNLDDVDVLLRGQKELGFQDYQPTTRAALKAFTDAVIRDYVKY